MGKVLLETKQNSLDQLLPTFNIAPEHSCELHSMSSEEQTLNLQIEYSQPIEKSNREENMQDDLDLTNVNTPSTTETDFGVTIAVVGGRNNIYREKLISQRHAISPSNESLLSPHITTNIILDPLAEAINCEQTVPANVTQKMQHSICLYEPLNLKDDMKSVCKGTTLENKMATVTRKRSGRSGKRIDVLNRKKDGSPCKEKLNETAENGNKGERHGKETETMENGNELGISPKERMVEATNNISETIKIRSINETLKNINKGGKAPKEVAAVAMEDKILKIESTHKEQLNKRGRGRPPKERITENMVDEEVVKESNTTKKSPRKQRRRTQVRKIMDDKTSLKGAGKRNNELSVVPSKRLCINRIDDAKSNKKKSALQIEIETPESLKFVLNAGCTTAQIENETQLNEEENQERFFIQSGSQVKTINDRIEFDCELDGDEPHNDVCHLNVEDQVVKMLDSAPMKIKLPFVKISPLWEALESSEVFLSMPQQPHFLPLKQYSEGYREGMAIGLMVTFSKLVENIRKLCISDPDEIIEQNMETLVDLERYGFNLYNLRDMLECFRTLKEDHKQVMDEIYATNELKSDERNKEDLLNEKLEAIHKSIMELERTKKSLNDEKSSTLEQVEGFDCEIIKLQNDKKAIEKSFLAAKSSLDCARGSMR